MADVTLRTISNDLYNTQFRPTFWTSEEIGYFISIDTAGTAVVYKKTIGGGLTWGSDVTINGSSARKISAWADWDTSGDVGTLIHIAYIGQSAVLYRNLDISDDSLSTEVNVISVSGGSGGSRYSGALPAIIDICKARGGNLFIAYYNSDVVTDTQGFERSTDGGATWDAKDEAFWEGVAERVILQPGDAADDNDIMLFKWDHSADELDRYLYDNSGDSWSSPTSISTSIVNIFADTHSWAAVHRHSDNHSILVAINDGDVWKPSIKYRSGSRCIGIIRKREVIVFVHIQCNVLGVLVIIDGSRRDPYSAVCQSCMR